MKVPWLRSVLPADEPPDGRDAQAASMRLSARQAATEYGRRRLII
ncbi:hypothetical protein GCM10011611_20300 [Aliidongia dinghuensis]|uniref:Uncharacterized protein n=1 Tax=Aliidongia dinghuensis TaxID=1867774 RepID=A0A8J2YSQ4_9PROT|nr:hypothetical protein GCM10011611_20300 [Aliidongia dinghuensis]